jgi:cytochrome c peroxidase
MRRLRTSVLLWFTIASGAAALAQSTHAFDWKLPPGFPTPRVPADNPMSVAKLELGRYLFYDKRLSGNGTYACATCHEQARAFTDGKARAVGSTGERHERGAMSLANIGYAGSLTWMKQGPRTLEAQALVPMFGDHPLELGLERPSVKTLAALREAGEYTHLFLQAFPGEADPFTLDNVARGISAFERTIISGRSPYDRYHYDRDDTAVTPAAKRGEQLFFSQPLSCFRCHGGFNFSSGTDFEGRRGGEGEGRDSKYKVPATSP